MGNGKGGMGMAGSRMCVKERALLAGGAFNRGADAVADELFQEGDFFDPRDLVQVKYEMLRRVREQNISVTYAAATFGFSRVSYYAILHAFERDGLMGLLPQAKGPRRAHKLTDEVMQFISATLQAKPKETAAEIVETLRRELDLCVHVRSVERALARAKKNR